MLAKNSVTTNTGQWKRHLARWIPNYIICIVVALIIVVPLVATILGGFKTTPELTSNPFGWPKVFRWENYGNILAGETYWPQVLNSTIVMVSSVGLLLLVASLAAFIFARVEFPGRELVFNFFTLGMLFPITVAALPLYITLRQAGLLDNLLGIILPQVAFALPVAILILRGFFRSIPKELEEASHIDGCTSLGFFWRILIPLSRPALATVGVMNLVASWNNFLLPLLVLNKQQLWTLPLGVMQYQGQYGQDFAQVMAFVSLSMLPALFFYLLAERQLIAGLTAGAVKG